MQGEERAASIHILHFNDVYEIEPRARDPVGGVCFALPALLPAPCMPTRALGGVSLPHLKKGWDASAQKGGRA